MTEATTIVGSNLLVKIDQLFACNVGNSIALPQIVVVRDQSSGTSSVLEGLTGLPFPRDSGLCTRFATQITFRRSTEAYITISIIPAKNSSSQDRERLQGWTKSGLKSLDAATFAGLMAEVAKVIGIGATTEQCQKTFSNDQHFSVIDVPGIFKRTTHGLTTKEDIAMVNNMVHEYMSNPRSVMLTFVPCNVDIATQEILERAEDVDPERIRTLGFFAKEHPWNTLEKEKVGIELLRSRLQEVLEDLIRREFPNVKGEMNQMLRKLEQDLKALEPKRQSQTEQSQYLMDIALGFQKITSLAIHSDYSRSNLLEKGSQLRLATEAVTGGQKFADTMALYGYSYTFKLDSKALNEVFANAITSNISDELNEEIDQGDDAGSFTADNSKATPCRLNIDHLDVQDVVYPNTDVLLPSEMDIMACLKKEYEESRGFELGTFDASLLGVTMKQQAADWRDLALGHISDIIVLVHNFIFGVLEHLTPNHRVYDGIKSRLIDDMINKYQKAMLHTKFVFRQECLRSQLEQCAISNRELGVVVKLSDVVQNNPLSNENHTVLQVHDILQSYCKVARKRFVDCVRMQVADTLLVAGSDTPLTFLEDIVGEDSVVKRRRQYLEKD
ncbi:dynamin GTPase [Periconia macrospinosa]|uniref:Dynamin GTPase n=1 Tax=Periconia macrospinosa TaxID=97972 RepID=A0A2V1DD61_9PLEO|nr:dynamin GTPase [Periconia macrospinosa]